MEKRFRAIYDCSAIDIFDPVYLIASALDPSTTNLLEELDINFAVQCILPLVLFTSKNFLIHFSFKLSEFCPKTPAIDADRGNTDLPSTSKHVSTSLQVHKLKLLDKSWSKKSEGTTQKDIIRKCIDSVAESQKGLLAFWTTITNSVI